jgi:hypothetical protein
MTSLQPYIGKASPVALREIADAIENTLPEVAEDIRAKVFVMARRLKSIVEQDGVELDKASVYAIADEWDKRAREKGVTAEPGVVRANLANGLKKAKCGYDESFKGCVEARMKLPLSPIAAERFPNCPAMQRAWLVVETAANCNRNKGEFPLSGKTLGDLIGVSQRTASDYLQQFIALELIEQAKDYKFKKAARCYRLVAQVVKVVQRVVTWAETVTGKVWKLRGTLRKLVTGTSAASEADTHQPKVAPQPEIIRDLLLVIERESRGSMRFDVLTTLYRTAAVILPDGPKRKEMEHNAAYTAGRLQAELDEALGRTIPARDRRHNNPEWERRQNSEPIPV